MNIDIDPTACFIRAFIFLTLAPLLYSFSPSFCVGVQACASITSRWSPFGTSAMQQKTQKEREEERDSHAPTKE